MTAPRVRPPFAGAGGGSGPGPPCRGSANLARGAEATSRLAGAALVPSLCLPRPLLLRRTPPRSAEARRALSSRVGGWEGPVGPGAPPPPPPPPRRAGGGAARTRRPAYVYAAGRAWPGRRGPSREPALLQVRCRGPVKASRPPRPRGPSRFDGQGRASPFARSRATPPLKPRVTPLWAEARGPRADRKP